MHLKNSQLKDKTQPAADTVAKTGQSFGPRLAPWLGLVCCLLICACGQEQRDPLTSAGMRFFLDERYSDAITAFHQALRNRDDDYEVHHYLGRSYLSLGKFPQALRALEHAIELAPQKPKKRAENLGNLAEITSPETAK